jgi:hypothetical protein
MIEHRILVLVPISLHNDHWHTSVIKKIGLVGSGVQLDPQALPPPIGLLCQPRVIMMMEKLVEWWLEYSEKTCPSATFSTTNPTCSARMRSRAAAVGNRRLNAWAWYGTLIIIIIIIIWFVRLLALRPLLAYCASVIVKMIVEKQMECRLAGETIRSSPRKPAPEPLLSITKSHMTRPAVWTRAAAVGSRRLTAWAMARPTAHFIHYFYAKQKLGSRLLWNFRN